MERTRCWGILCAVLLPGANSAWGQCELSTAASPVFQANLAEIAMEGDTLAAMYETTETQPSMLRIYRRMPGTWQQEAQFEIPRYRERLFHTRKVSTDGSRVIVGVEGIPNLALAGEVHIFAPQNGTWIAEKVIYLPPEVRALTVDISGDAAAVGTAVGSLTIPAAYLFRRQGSNWVEEETFLCESSAGSSFPRAIAIENDLLAMGDETHCGVLHPAGGGSAGAKAGEAGFKERAAQASALSCAGPYLYVFRRTAGTWLAEDVDWLNGPACPGANLKVESGRIISIVGTFFNGDFEYGLAVWGFDGSQWAAEQELPIAGDAHYLYIPTVEALGNRILVGAPRPGPLSPYLPGLAVLFSESGGTWSELARFVSQTPSNTELYGRDAAMNESSVVVFAETPATGHEFDISDCDADGLPDVCPGGCEDAQACGDCNNNGTRDGCDVDCDGNSVPDDCECVELPFYTDVAAACCNNRFVEVVLPDSCQRSAARVKMVSLNHPMPPGAIAAQDFSAFEAGAGCVEGPNGCVRWSGAAGTYLDSPQDGTLLHAAMLSCTPQYQDWSGQVTVALTGAEVVPSSAYVVQFLDEGCDPSVESNYSAAVLVETSRWGDVAAPHQDPMAPSANQPSAIDIARMVDKVKDLPLSIPRVSAEMSSRLISLSNPTNATDIAASVDSVKGARYPFAGPSICPN